MATIQNIYDNPVFFENYKLLRENNQGFNNLIEQPAIISLLSDLKEKKILDIGCGFGNFSRYASENGAASILSIDPSSNMIQEAKKLTQHKNIFYQQAAIENFEADADSFDIIVASLVFHYVQDLRSVIKKIYGWLNSKGIFVFSVEHPICTAYPDALPKVDEKGRLFHPVYNYRDENIFKQTWFVENVEKYHRTISTYINLLIEMNLQIEKILEPMPGDELIKEREQFAIHKVRPPLFMVKAKKMDISPYSKF